MEISDKYALYNDPLNPYTQALLSAIPVTNLDNKKSRIILKGDVPSPINPPAGCRFCTRCFKAQKRCFDDMPELKEVKRNHLVSCHFWNS